MSDRPVRVLAIDGGGIRGLIAARLLSEIEHRTRRPISCLFDLLAGTSTGGILALALTKPASSAAGPAHTAAEMVDFYERQGPAIFSRPLVHRLRTFNGMTGSRYDQRGINGALESFFGQARLKHAITPVLITSYELERRIPFFFRSHRACKKESYDYPMHVVARCTSAAPTYFPPQKVSTGNRDDYYALIDGGVFANNPAACAYVEAKSEFKDSRDFTVVSVGTGTADCPILFEKANLWGIAQWARPLLGTVLDGVASTVDYQLQQLLPQRSDGTSRYFRLQTKLQEANAGMDFVRRSNLRQLRLTAEATIHDRSTEIDRICRQLTD